MPFRAASLAGLLLIATAIRSPMLAFAQDLKPWSDNQSNFHIISAAPLYGNRNVWLLLAQRIPDSAASADAELVLINRRLIRLFYATEAQSRRMYDNDVRNLEDTVAGWTADQPAVSDALVELQYVTIPRAMDEIRRTVFAAQLDINRLVRLTQAAVGTVVAEAVANAKRTRPTSTDVLVAGAVKRIDKEWLRCGQKIRDRIASGNGVVDANIAVVKANVVRLLPADVSKKVLEDIRTEDVALDAVVAEGDRAVVAEVKRGRDRLVKKLLAIVAIGNKR